MAVSARAIHGHNAKDAHVAKVAVDNTFASPVNQRPLELGADFASPSICVATAAGTLMGSKADLAQALR